MNWIVKYAFSSIGSKQLVAITGAGLLVFLLVHFLGNSLLFKGADALNHYAVTLHSLGVVLWLIRLGLLVFFVLHVFFALKLTLDNTLARPVGYAKRVYVEASLVSRTMWITGILILVFLTYHLAHFTFHIIHPDIAEHYTAQANKDVYKMVVLGFSNPMASLSYIFAMLCLGLHLSHGIGSMCQTLGIFHPKYNMIIKTLSYCIAWGLALGNISYPLSVLLKIVSL